MFFLRTNENFISTLKIEYILCNRAQIKLMYNFNIITKTDVKFEHKA